MTQMITRLTLIRTIIKITITLTETSLTWKGDETNRWKVEAHLRVEKDRVLETLGSKGLPVSIENQQVRLEMSPQVFQFSLTLAKIGWKINRMSLFMSYDLVAKLSKMLRQHKTYKSCAMKSSKLRKISLSDLLKKNTSLTSKWLSRWFRLSELSKKARESLERAIKV